MADYTKQVLLSNGVPGPGFNIFTTPQQASFIVVDPITSTPYYYNPRTGAFTAFASAGAAARSQFEAGSRKALRKLAARLN